MSSIPSLALTPSDMKEDDTEASLCEALPKELQAKILTHMPLHDFLKFRLVCKSWDSFLKDASFRKSFIMKRYEFPILIAAFKGKRLPEFYGGYNVGIGAWRRPFPLFFSPKPDSRLLGTAGGLILWRTGKIELIGGQVSDNRKLLVNNPLTKAERQLPSMSAFRETKQFDKIHVTLLLDAETNEYSVLVIHLEFNDRNQWVEESDMQVELFTSKKNCWENMGSIPQEVRKCRSITSILHNKELYCLFNKSGAPSLYRVGRSFWLKIDLDFKFLSYHISPYLYQSGPYLSIVAVTRAVGRTVIKNSRLQFTEGGNRCNLEKTYCRSLTAFEEGCVGSAHIVCASETHIFYMCSPYLRASSQVNRLSRLIAFKQPLEQDKGMEDGSRSLVSRVAVSHTQNVPTLRDFYRVTRIFLYEPRLDLDV